METVENPLRFPGQYFDAETGLHYNYHRYYDPLTGRYTQPDPIGFAGGDVNWYAYVGNNPINLIDVLGLSGCTDFVETIIQRINEQIAAEQTAGPACTISESEKAETKIVCEYVPVSAHVGVTGDCNGLSFREPQDYSGFCPQLSQGGQNAQLYRHLAFNIRASLTEGVLLSTVLQWRPEYEDCNQLQASCGCHQMPSAATSSSAKNYPRCLQNQAEVIGDRLGVSVGLVLKNYLDGKIPEWDARNQLKVLLCGKSCGVTADSCCK